MNFFEAFGFIHVVFYCCIGIYFLGRSLYRYHEAVKNGKTEELRIYQSIR